MKNLELLALGLRIIGVYGLVKTVQYAGVGYQYVRQLMEHMPNESLLYWYGAYGLTITGLFMFSLLMLKFPISMARKLLPTSEEQEVGFKGSLTDIQNTAFTLLGVYILATAIPDLVYNSTVIFYLHKKDSSLTYETNYLISLVVTLIQIFIGIYLCTNAENLSGVLKKYKKTRKA